MDKDIRKKIANCKALQGMTVTDVIRSEKFLTNLAAYMKAQRDDRASIRRSYEAMKRVGGFPGYKLPAHPIDKVINMTARQFADEFLNVIGKVSALPAAQRAYIHQLGIQAYNLTVAQYVCEEYPELESILLPKSKAN